MDIQVQGARGACRSKNKVHTHMVWGGGGSWGWNSCGHCPSEDTLSFPASSKSGRMYLPHLYNDVMP